MTLMHGFTLLREARVPELNLFCQLYRHEKTGAELLSVQNDDENKVFAINFRTPNADSTGIAHIMEHSVLCGSRKYPVKEPFVELLKGSLNTFLNAFTFPDKTCYPVASQNVKDFYNLIDVYMDAVFYPLIPEHILQQEGWHFELETLDGPMGIRGVVYNEMKGNYSSPTSMMAEHVQSALFPDNVYQFDSGGNPQFIPDLTYAQFKHFHETMYHPSNARIYFYGDDDPEERLRVMDTWLQAYERIPVHSQVDLQPRLSQPRRLIHGYNAGEDPGDLENVRKSMLTVSWLLHPTADQEKAFAWGILEHILVGTPASPLRKALVDSGLGEDLLGVGLEDQLRQMYFSTGLKGIKTEDAGKVEAVIQETLERLARDGIDPAAIEASLNTLEFRLRENNTGSFPRGLLLMLRTLSTWNYGGDPIDQLFFEDSLSAIRAQALLPEQKSGGYFEKMIQQDLLENMHRVTVLMVPDLEARAKTEAIEQERIAGARAKMSEADLQAIIQNTARLKQIQETPDSPEALATIPSLGLADLDPKNKPIPQEKIFLGEIPVLYHDLFTNGILYLDLAFDLHTLPQDVLPFVPLFCRALVEMGTQKEDYVRLIQRIGSKTGGINATRLVSAIQDRPDTAAWLVMRGKGTYKQIEDLLAIIKDILLEVNFDNRERFKQMALESKARMETSLVHSGNMVVANRLRAHFHEADWVGEVMGGIEQLFFLRKLIQEIDEDWPGVLEKLETIRCMVFSRGSEEKVVVNVTADQAGWALLRDRLEGFLGILPTRKAQKVNWQPASYPAREGLTLPSQVNFVGKAANLFKAGYQFKGSHLVARRYLGTTYLWEKVRIQGGAYGASSIFDRGTGTYTFLSYRDPNLVQTLGAYDQAGDFLKGTQVSQDELVKTIIGTIGAFDAYMLPDARGFTAMVRTLTGVTEEELQKMRDQVLSTTLEDFHTFGNALDIVKNSGHVVVLGSTDAIQSAVQAGVLDNVTKVL